MSFSENDSPSQSLYDNFEILNFKSHLILNGEKGTRNGERGMLKRGMLKRGMLKRGMLKRKVFPCGSFFMKQRLQEIHNGGMKIM